MSFVSDLALGQRAEREFAKVLLDTENVISLEFSTGKFKYRDIKINTPEWEKTYEIKFDRQAEQTGNYAIEYLYKWNPSWIFESKADYIVYNIKGERRIAKRWALILGLMDIEKRTTKWWDSWASSLWVLKCETLPTLFNKVEYNGK